MLRPMDAQPDLDDTTHLRVSAHRGAIVIAVHGVLDERAVGLIGEAARCALNCQARRVRIDFDEVGAHTAAAVRGLAALREQVPPGRGGRITYHANSAAGQAVLATAAAGG